MGVRLPPDTEIIKYTSSIVGPKMSSSASGSSNSLSTTGNSLSTNSSSSSSRGRKKAISDDQPPPPPPPHSQANSYEFDSTTNVLSHMLSFSGLSPAKRARLEMEYAAIAAAAAANAAQHNAVSANSLSGLSGSGVGNIGIGSGIGLNNTVGNNSANAAAVAAAVAAGLPNNLTPSQMAALSNSLAVSNSNAMVIPVSNSSGLHQNLPAHIDLTTNSGIGGGGGSSSSSSSCSDRLGSGSGGVRDMSCDRVEVIKLPPTINSNGAYNLSNKNKDVHDLTGGSGGLSGITGIGGISGLGCDSNAGVNLSLKSSSASNTLMSGTSLTTTSLMNSVTPSASMASITIEDFDTPLNLSMKPDKSSSIINASTTCLTSVSASLNINCGTPNDLSNRLSDSLCGMSGSMLIGSGSSGIGVTGGSNSSLQSLSSITAALGGSGNNSNHNSSGLNNLTNNNNNINNNGNIMNLLPSNAIGLNSNNGAVNMLGTANSNDRQPIQPTFKEGRPRNLGRGVSKPKKNTVASLLAQSRAVGLKPMLATQQLLQQGADIVNIFF